VDTYSESETLKAKAKLCRVELSLGILYLSIKTKQRNEQTYNKQ
jgi:hypothetical protein